MSLEKEFMHLFKNPTMLILFIATNITLFYFAHAYGIASRLADVLSPCNQDPANPFPCNGGYDIALMLVSAGQAFFLIIVLILRYLKHKFRSCMKIDD